MTKAQIKTKTAKDVLVEYQEKYQFSDADLMDLFGVTRQMVWSYLKGISVPGIYRLRWLAVTRAGEWEGEMAREILKIRGIDMSELDKVAA